MNALDLIERIAQEAGVTLEVREEEDVATLESFEVKLAIQPSWPFEHSIRSVVGPDEWDEDPDDETVEHPKFIYIGEGGQEGYLSGQVAQAVFH